MTNTTLASAAFILVGVLCLRTGYWPSELLSRALIHWRASLLWLRLDVWPAILQERWMYRTRVHEARNRL